MKGQYKKRQTWPCLHFEPFRQVLQFSLVGVLTGKRLLSAAAEFLHCCRSYPGLSIHYMHSSHSSNWVNICESCLLWSEARNVTFLFLNDSHGSSFLSGLRYCAVQCVSSVIISERLTLQSSCPAHGSMGASWPWRWPVHPWCGSYLRGFGRCSPHTQAVDPWAPTLRWALPAVERVTRQRVNLSAK